MGLRAVESGGIVSSGSAVYVAGGTTKQSNGQRIPASLSGGVGGEDAAQKVTQAGVFGVAEEFGGRAFFND